MGSDKAEKVEDAKGSQSEQKEVVEPEKESAEKEVALKEVHELRQEVNKVSSDLTTAITDLKKSIVDIRSAVSEIENPFNLLRVISSEKDLKKFNRARLPPGTKTLILGKPEEKAPEEQEVEEKHEEEKHPPFEKETALEPQPIEPKPEPKMEEYLPKAEPQSHAIGYGYLDWVWSLLHLGLSSDDIGQLANSYEFMGYLPAKSSECIHSLAVASEKVRSKGLNRSQMLLSMYKAAAISGIMPSLEDVKKLVSIAERKLKNRKYNKRRSK